MRDTVWLIWDTTANWMLPVDTQLYENRCNINYSQMNVFTFNWENDSCKATALPYSYFPEHAIEIWAINVQYPLTISWDTSLFHAPFLPADSNSFINVAYLSNSYFFFHGNDPLVEGYNMLIDNSANAPSIIGGSQFPLYVFIKNASLINIDEKTKNKNISTNIIDDYLYINSKIKINEICIYSIDGKLKYKNKMDDFYPQERISIPLKYFANGIYLIYVQTMNKNIEYEKFIKMD